jgi:hypothetical protein
MFHKMRENFFISGPKISFSKMAQLRGSKGKGKAVPLQAWNGPEGSGIKVPRFHDNGIGWW